MNWDAIGAVGEIIGAIAVVFSLIYLSIQVRHNSKMAEAAALQDVLDSYSQNLIATRLQNPNLSENFYQGATNFDSLSGKEQRVFFDNLAAFILHFNNIFQLHEKNLISEDDYQAWLSFIGAIIQSDGGKKCWLHMQKTIAPNLTSAINFYLDKNPGTPSIYEIWDLWNDNGAYRDSET